MLQSLLVLLALGKFFQPADTHGMLLEPVNRASRWRFDPRFPTDYNDNQGFCGGYYTQWILRGGNCGLCGDDYGLPAPRPHEHGGVYGDGTIVKSYNAGDVIPIGVLITANHLGYFVFDLCNMDINSESESCFNEYQLQLYTGGDRYFVSTDNRGWFNTTLKLPEDLVCSHCVLRWTYITGNSWGICQDGSEAVGCGPQENFRSCADVRILTRTEPQKQNEYPVDFLDYLKVVNMEENSLDAGEDNTKVMQEDLPSTLLGSPLKEAESSDAQNSQMPVIVEDILKHEMLKGINEILFEKQNKEDGKNEILEKETDVGKNHEGSSFKNENFVDNVNNSFEDSSEESDYD